MRNQFIIAGIIAASVSFSSGALAATETAKPNIILILADDLGFGDTGCYGATKIPTPNIDRLGAQGLRFTDAHATSATCTPSRYSLLTGQHPWRKAGKYSHLNDVPTFNKFGGTQPTVAKYLQATGYYTGMIGKWHLGGTPTGFDRLEILPGQGIYFDHLIPELNCDRLVGRAGKRVSNVASRGISVSSRSIRKSLLFEPRLNI